MTKAIWLLSDGRSGSTWCAQVLAHAGRLRVEHEPVHAAFNPRLAGEPLLPLPATADLEGTYRPLLADVLAGRHRSDRFAGERAPARPAGTLIRDIHALLIAPQLLAVFPELQPVLLVRHPLAVAQSKVALADWRWFGDPAALAADPLVFARLGARHRWIEQAQTPLRRYVLVWAIMHRWFLAHAPADRLTVLRYPASEADMAAAAATLLGGDAQRHLRDPGFAAAYARRSATDQAPARESRRLFPALLGRLTGRDQLARADRAFAEEVIDDFGLRPLLEGKALRAAA